MSGPNLPFLLQIGNYSATSVKALLRHLKTFQLSFVLIASGAYNLWQGDEILHLFSSEVPALILLAY